MAPHQPGGQFCVEYPRAVINLVLFNILVRDLDEEINETFINDTKLGGVANTVGDNRSVQEGFARMEYWAKTNKRKFNKEKCKIVHLGTKKKSEVPGIEWAKPAQAVQYVLVLRWITSRIGVSSVMWAAKASAFSVV